mgnify:CR=1 FL=1|tara:strand:- start:225 stop:443 length:219 start_codon:yes stop_codon:yes gene_type:complete
MDNKKEIKEIKEIEEYQKLEKIFIYIFENYDVKDFIEQLSDYYDINSDSSESDNDDKKIEINVDDKGFHSIK